MDSPSGSHEPGSQESSAGPIRISQRQPQSCTECTRRKTRCDKQVPCHHCRRRGVVDKCRIEQVIPSKDVNRASQFKILRQDMLTANAQLSTRVAELERLVRTALQGQTLPDVSMAAALPVSSPSSPMATATPTATPSPSPSGSTTSHQAEDDHGDARRDSLEGGDDDEAEAAATLEFLAIGRLRAASPGGLQEDTQWADASALGGDPDTDLQYSISPMSGRGNTGLPAVTLSLLGPSTHVPMNAQMSSMRLVPAQPYLPNRQLLVEYRQAIKAEMLARLPPAAIGRALVQYDIEKVAWMHCCYHGPTFQSESDLFWAEVGSHDVEINWSFLALLFGVLMASLASHAMASADCDFPQSAAYHLPEDTFSYLFPSQKPLGLISTWFEACEMCLREADWMRSHSLYAVQCVAVITSAANHIGKADLYFTLLGAAVRVAQALNLHRLGPDDPRLYKSKTSKLIIAREVRKRTWYQLVYQDAFHVAFNGACSINRAQFNTPPPLHCMDSKLSQGAEEATVSLEIPTTDSHVCQLHKLALQVNRSGNPETTIGGAFADVRFRAYSTTDNLAILPYDKLLEIDHEMQVIRDEAPAWMRDETVPLAPEMPAWADWQRRAYIISASHKVIVLHRPYLGRAFRKDSPYARSRENCLEHAHKILRMFKACALQQFRTTWTVLVHAVAASLILLLDASHKTDPDPGVADSIQTVRDTIEILRGLVDHSIIAKKGFLVLSPLVEGSAQLAGAGSGSGSGARPSENDRNAFLGKAEVELKRALDVFRRAPPIIPPVISPVIPSTTSASQPSRGPNVLRNEEDTDSHLTALSGTVGMMAQSADQTPIAVASGEAYQSDTLDPFAWLSQSEWGSLDPAGQVMDWDNLDTWGLGDGTSGMDWMGFS